MATETLTITALSTLNNYIIVDGSIGPKGSTRLVQYYYPKASTNFAKSERITQSGKGPIIENIYEISNHMTGGRCLIPELLVTSIMEGGLSGKAFTIPSFIDFCTLNTGA